MNPEKFLEGRLPRPFVFRGESLGLKRRRIGMQNDHDNSRDDDHEQEDQRLTSTDLDRGITAPPAIPRRRRQDRHSSQNEAIVPFERSGQKQASGILSAQ